MWLFGRNRDAGMEVFIGNLPKKTSLNDIAMLLGEHFPDTTIRFNNKHFTNGSSIKYCVVPFRTRKQAEKAMKEIQHKKIGRKYLNIHEFHHRSYHNDRRLNFRTPEYKNEKRSMKRRRQEQFVEPRLSTSYLTTTQASDH